MVIILSIPCEMPWICLLYTSGTDRVKVQNALVGGGVGGKEDMTVQHLASLLTYATKKPVKMKLTRAESLLVHPKRHPFYMDMTCLLYTS